MTSLPTQERPTALWSQQARGHSSAMRRASVQRLPPRGKHPKPELCRAWQDTCPLIGASVYVSTAPGGEGGSYGAAGLEAP